MKRFGIAVCLFLMLALLCGLAVHADSAADTALVSYIYMMVTQYVLQTADGFVLPVLMPLKRILNSTGPAAQRHI